MTRLIALSFRFSYLHPAISKPETRHQGCGVNEVRGLVAVPAQPIGRPGSILLKMQLLRSADPPDHLVSADSVTVNDINGL